MKMAKRRKTQKSSVASPKILELKITVYTNDLKAEEIIVKMQAPFTMSKLIEEISNGTFIAAQNIAEHSKFKFEKNIEPLEEPKPSIKLYDEKIKTDEDIPF